MELGILPQPQIPGKLIWDSKYIAVYETQWTPHSQCFNCYAFILTYTPFPDIRVDNRRISMGKRRLLAINPGQQISYSLSAVPKYTLLLADVNYVNSIAGELTSPSIAFDNYSAPIDPCLLSLLNMARDEVSGFLTGHQRALDSLEIIITVLLIRQGGATNLQPEKAGACAEKKSVKTAIEFISANFSRNFSLEELARSVNYSPCHFLRLFKASTGRTPYDFINEFRIKQAKLLLSENPSSRSIAQIGYDCGFNNVSHFTSLFRKKAGMTPTEYRKVTAQSNGVD